MRSIVNKQALNHCGICGSTIPYIEYKKMDDVEFIWCNKCHTITFNTDVDDQITHDIEKKMNFYQPIK